MSEIDAIIFDLDDTLYPERAFVMSGFRAASVFAASVAPVCSETLVERLQNDFTAGVRGNAFEVALRSVDAYSEQLEAEMVDAYRSHAPTLTPFPEVVATLEQLQTSTLR